MYSLGVLVLVDGHNRSWEEGVRVDIPSCRGRITILWFHAYLPCLQRMPTQKLWITPGCIQAERS